METFQELFKKPISPYAKFHFKFKGKTFFLNGRQLTKPAVWYEYVEPGKVKVEDLDDFFVIKDKEGWRNGELTAVGRLENLVT